ncbi:uncharacterized protein LOC132601433 [Lycium barbarum]|uniref:uncharacterized protein LOC132601433 n=1 Tax=Lycium barbarum TaxID=112863 RepID=UPI00293E33AA|nr:uncharacterized protein LOC132601433 [Lycium barbarum]
MNNFIDGPWCMGGEFNVIMDPDEKLGGRPHRTHKSMYFITCMEDSDLSAIGFSGPRYTWCNNFPHSKRVWKRLDRILINDEWTQLFPHNSVRHLSRSGSDHRPVLLKCYNDQGSSIETNIGDAFEHVQTWEAKIQTLESLDMEQNDEQDGDKNTKYFHSVLKNRSRRLQIYRIKIQKGKWIQKENNINKAIVKYFKRQFNLNHPEVDNNMLNQIPMIITDAENDTLTKVPQEDEIKQGVFNMNIDISIGPDGFNDMFFKFC